MDVTSAFEGEIARLRAAGVAGAGGRLADLFDWLAARGPDEPGASQAEIGEGVFGPGSADAEDATVRVYVHRLRKRIEDHYAANPPAAGAARVELPAGTYALRLRCDPALHPPAATGSLRPVVARRWLVLAVLAALAAVLAMLWLNRADRPNPVWQGLAESGRPVLLVVGDYYLYGEIDPVRPDEGRLIRDFRVNSPEDLLRMQEAEPARYAGAEDMGLNYLPFSTAYAIEQIAPVLAGQGKEVEIIAASALRADQFTRYDIVYCGLISGLGLLQDPAFAGSGLRLGDSYDELHDSVSGRRFVSEEARRLASPAFYRDYAWLTRFEAPGGAQVVIVAGARDTGLRALARLASDPELPEELAQAARQPAFEALFEITGQQGADLRERMLLARAR